MDKIVKHILLRDFINIFESLCMSMRCRKMGCGIFKKCASLKAKSFLNVYLIISSTNITWLLNIKKKKRKNSHRLFKFYTVLYFSLKKDNIEQLTQLL